jgi:hypothetical protein
MRELKYLALAVIAGVAFTAATPKTNAQVAVEIGAPDCPYGYYDYAPYNCAPYGYYGPEWFNGGVFIGAGKWFHGASDFKGSVDNHYDVKHGYKGAMPARGEKATPEHTAPPSNFKGNESRDGRGHTAKK